MIDENIDGIIATIILVSISWVFLKKGISIRKTVFNKKLIAFLIIPSLAIAVYDGYSYYNYKGLELFFYMPIAFFEAWLVLIVFGLPGVAISLAMGRTIAYYFLTKEGWDYLLKDNRKDKDNG